MYKKFDGHLHTFRFKVPLRESIWLFKKEFEAFKVKKATFLALPCDPVPGRFGLETTDYIDNLRAMYFKCAFAPNAYAYAGLQYDKLDLSDKKAVAEDLLRQVKEFRKVGYDGMKMYEGHPNLHKILGYDLDDEVYDLFFDYCEKENFPIIMHLANAEYMWHKDQISEYWLQRGCCFDETFPSFNRLLEEVIKMLEKHPKLNFTLAHFGFMTYDRKIAEKFMSFENTKMDVCPGTNNYVNITEDRGYWRDFFIRFADKIVYGTDTYNFDYENQAQFVKISGIRPSMVERFLETDDTFDYAGNKLTGIKLPKKVLKKIYYSNLDTMMGEPQKPDFDYLIEKSRELLKGYSAKDFEYYNLWCMTHDFETFKKGGKIYE